MTFGECATDPSVGNYPNRLDTLINDTNKFEVVNYGIKGRTMMKSGDKPFS